MDSKYVPSYGCRKIWIQIPEIVDATIQAIKEKIISLRDENTPRSDVIILELVNALKEEVDLGNVSFDLVELMLNTEKREIITLLPFLLTAYTLNYSSNKLMKEATEKIKNESDFQYLESGNYTGFQQIFEVKGNFACGERTNYNKNVDTLSKRFMLKHRGFPNTKFDNSLSELDFNKSAEYLHKAHIFSKFAQLCREFDGVNLTLSLYAFQYYTLALSVLRICKLGDGAGHNNEVWCDNCEAKENCFEFNMFSKLFPENSQDGSIDYDFNRGLVLDFANTFLDIYPIKVIKEMYKYSEEKDMCISSESSYDDVLKKLMNQGWMSEDEYEQASKECANEDLDLEEVRSDTDKIT